MLSRIKVTNEMRERTKRWPADEHSLILNIRCVHKSSPGVFPRAGRKPSIPARVTACKGIKSPTDPQCSERFRSHRSMGKEEWGSRDGAEHFITLLTNMSELNPKDNNTQAAAVHAREDNYSTTQLKEDFFPPFFHISNIILLV